MNRYRTRSREITAFHWNGETTYSIPMGMHDYIVVTATVVVCHTKQGPVHAVRGDWLILGDGEVYPCKPDEFEKRYEVVTDG